MKETNVFVPWFYREVSEAEKQLIQNRQEEKQAAEYGASDKAE